MLLRLPLSFIPDSRRAQWAIILSVVAHIYFLLFTESITKVPEVVPVITTYQIDLKSKDVGYEQAPTEDELPPAEPEQKQTTEDVGLPPPPPPEEAPKQKEEPIEPAPPKESTEPTVIKEQIEPKPVAKEPVEVEAPEPAEMAVEAPKQESKVELAEQETSKVEETPQESVPEIKPSLPKYQIGTKNNPKPPYPNLARKRGWQGTVVLGVVVMPDGRPHPRKITIIEGSEYAVFNFAAYETVRDEWIFDPARDGDIPVEGYLEVPIVFALQ